MLHCSTNKHFCHSCLLLPSFLRNSVSINFYLPRFIKLQFNGTNMFPLIYIQSSGLLWPASCLCSLVIGMFKSSKSQWTASQGLGWVMPRVRANWLQSIVNTISNLSLWPGLTGSCTAAGWRAPWWTPATARTWRPGPVWPEVSQSHPCHRV